MPSFNYEKRELFVDALYTGLINDLGLDFELAIDRPDLNSGEDELILTGVIFAPKEDINPPTKAVEIDTYITNYFRNHSGTSRIIKVEVKPLKEGINEDYEFSLEADILATEPFDV